MRGVILPILTGYCGGKMGQMAGIGRTKKEKLEGESREVWRWASLFLADSVRSAVEEIGKLVGG